jgi:hypothetical protein
VRPTLLDASAAAEEEDSAAPTPMPAVPAMTGDDAGDGADASADGGDAAPDA